MAKCILMSIKPKYVSMILNKNKTIEVRKRFPSDYVGWVYIYCTKDKKYANLINRGGFLTGMVVARFWCDKVEKIRSYLEPEQWYMTSDLGGRGLLQKSCLTFEELDDYLLSGYGYAIHITKLDIFDKPKDIYEMKRLEHFGIRNKCEMLVPITRAPQSWCYIEV